DLSLPEYPIASGVDADELTARIDRAVQALAQAQGDLMSLLNSPPRPVTGVEPLRTALLRMSYFGVPGAVPLSATGDGQEQLTALLAQAQSVAKEVGQRLDRIGKLAGADETTAEKRHEYQLARTREIFGPD